MPVPYMHITEALGLTYKTPFARNLGWDRSEVWKLVFRLVKYMSDFKNVLRMFSCGIDMEAWRKLSLSGIPLPSEIELCNRYVSQVIVATFAASVLEAYKDSEVITMHQGDLLNFVFDRNESFRRPFEDFINAERDEAERSGKSTIWQFVDGIAEDEMKQNPGIQAADILAWGTNRENTAREGKDGTSLAYIMKQVIAATWKEYDESRLLSEFGPPLPNAHL